MIFILMLACGDGAPTTNDGPQNPPLPGGAPNQENGPVGGAEEPAPNPAAVVEQPVAAEERDGENGRISLSAAVRCEEGSAWDELKGSKDSLLVYRRNSLPEQTDISWRSKSSDEPYAHENGAIAIIDLNGDLWDDVIIATDIGALSYINNGKGGFSKSAQWLSLIETQSITGLAAGDYDNDGKTDLFVSQFMAPDLLLRNTGSQFEVVSVGISNSENISGGAAWMDYDGDGDLDLFTAAHGKGPEGEFSDKPKLSKADQNRLYENDNNKFRSRTNKLSYGGKEPYTYTGIWLPLDDKDGWDLFLVNDFGEFVTPHIGLSNQGGFSPIRDKGFDIASYGTGGAVSDWNQDGVPDILVTGIGDPSLLMSENGNWVDKAGEMGLASTDARTTTWGAAVVDMDNDGDDDIWMTAGPIFFPENDGSLPNAEKQVDGLFMYENGSFSTPSWAFSDVRNSRSAVAADFNRDGFWEVVVNPIDGPTDIYWGICNDSGWLDIRLEDSKGNQAGLGATVEVKAGDKTWTRWMTSGSGFGTSAPKELHFGLSTIAQVDMITVTWADGEVSRFKDVPTKRKVVVSR